MMPYMNFLNIVVYIDSLTASVREGGIDGSIISKEDMEAIWIRKQEATIKRERMKKYSFSLRVLYSEIMKSC